jgi:hypothetical protein
MIALDTQPQQQSRFFYHSFPRRGRSSESEISKGCQILSLICDIGLLLAPEIVAWSYPHADGTPARKQQIIQRRICFTELAPVELTGHAEEFGHFALEFDVSVIKRLGAMPVFYIPQPVDEDTTEITSLGSTLVVQSMDAMILAMRLAGVKRLVETTLDECVDCTFGFQRLKTFNFDAQETRNFIDGFTYALTPPDMLEQALAGLLNCFYPADNVRDNKALAYYRQREWRIAWNFAIRGEEVMRRTSDEVVARLLDLDSDFFGRAFETSAGMSQLAREAWILPGVSGKRIVELVNRIVVPSAALRSAQAIIARSGTSVPVISIEEMLEFSEQQ